ncbi:MAG: hypothetical protein KDA31_08930 [Phycisphaerales bacterium]|nr:hypothetical protein [Phycisphaerales bacterium]MCB9836853.1 hypothetical protein [Phycisphaera sp.]
MPQWLEITLGIGAIVLVGFALVIALNFMSLLGLADADVAELDHAAARSEIEKSQPDNAWANRNGYRWIGAYELHAGMNPKAVILAWQKPGVASYFCVYYILKYKVYDLVSVYKGDITLTTGSHDGSLLYPMPSFHFMQAFTRLDLERLAERHAESEQYLVSRLGVESLPYFGSFTDLFLEAISRQAEHVRSVPFWWVKVLWWYAIKGFKNNKPVERRYPDLDRSDLMRFETASVRER